MTGGVLVGYGHTALWLSVTALPRDRLDVTGPPAKAADTAGDSVVAAHSVAPAADARQ